MKAPVKALVCEVPDDPVAHAQTEGFRIYRRPLARRLGLVCEHVTPDSLDALREHVMRSDADIAFVMVSWRTEPEATVNLMRELREQTAHRLRLIFLDYYAPTCSPVFGLLPYVDCYAKRQVLADPALYQQSFRGGHIFVDYFSRRFDFDVGDWDFGSPLPVDHAHKLTYVWNLGVRRRYVHLLRFSRLFPRRWDRRTYDVHGRIGLGKNVNLNEWYHAYRHQAAERTQKLGERYRVTPPGRIRPRKFLWELRDSRIAVSPFGWGEVCYRDYEAVVCGALLFKPSMSHLRTNPDIFKAHDTYVPLAWDLSDLEEKVAYYLAHPDEAVAIIRRAQAVLSHYYHRGGFVDDVARVIEPTANGEAAMETRASVDAHS